jgi:predicted Rossmann-fold nucleotide-binding protein
MALAKIISGGQTGVDRAALDAALELGFPCGGSCPEDRAAEDGTIPARYPITPLAGADYSERTLQNVLDADGTVIVCHGVPRGGTRLTLVQCQRHRKPFLVIDSATTTRADAVGEVSRFLREHPIRVLNVAGPRASEWPEGYGFVHAVMRDVLAKVYQ